MLRNHCFLFINFIKCIKFNNLCSYRRYWWPRLIVVHRSLTLWIYTHIIKPDLETHGLPDVVNAACGKYALHVLGNYQRVSRAWPLLAACALAESSASACDGYICFFLHDSWLNRDVEGKKIIIRILQTLLLLWVQKSNPARQQRTEKFSWCKTHAHLLQQLWRNSGGKCSGNFVQWHNSPRSKLH